MSRSLYSKLLRTYGTLPGGAERRAFALSQQQKFSAQFAAPMLTALPATPADVIVIGAGFAGLSAAYHLVSAQHRVTVLEARDKIGGRVLSNRDQFARGQIIEFGAELIGANHRSWVNLALQFGLSFNVVTDDQLFEEADLVAPLIIGGRKIDPETARRLFINMDMAVRLLDVTGADVKEDRPWESPGAEQLDEELLGPWFRGKIDQMKLPPAEAGLLKEALDAEFTNDNAVSWDAQSLLAVLSQIKAHGGSKKFGEFTEVYRCSAGNDMLATKLEEHIGRANIKLNEPVTDIILNGNKTSVVINNGQKHYTADYIVLAAPPTVWQDITRDEEILRLRSQSGPAIKYMTAVADRFWIKDKLSPSGLCGDIGMTWEGTDNQSELPGKPMDISCFAGGSVADHILKQSDPKAFYDERLEGIFPGFSAAAIDSHLQNWPAEAYIKTGYSFPGRGEVCSKVKLLNQAYKERLFFAGEHACPGFWGFMEGALRSGIIAAKNIQQAAAKDR